MTRKEFEMTEDQYKNLLAACRPVVYLVANGMEPRSQQQNANDAWCELGREMGFDGMTVQPSDRGRMFFTAEAIEPASSDEFFAEQAAAHSAAAVEYQMEACK